MTGEFFPDASNAIEEIEITNPEIPPVREANKRSVLDVKAKDSQGRIFHVEVQVGFQARFSKRSLYYLASLIRDQLSVSEEYSQLKPVYQINIIDFGLFETTRYLSCFTLREDTDPDMANAAKILEFYSADPVRRQELEDRMKADRDFAYEVVAQYEKGVTDGIQKGLEKGRTEGREEGLEIGLEKGKRNTAWETARILKAKGYPKEDVLESTGLSDRDWESI